MVTREARIAIDAPPLGADLPSARDYNAFRLFGLTAAPPFVDGVAAGTLTQPGPTEWTVRLDRMYWSDGAPLTGRDFAHAIAHLVAERLSPFRVYLRDLVGYRECLQTGDPTRLTGVDGDDHNLKIRLARPNVALPKILSMAVFSPVRTDEVAGAYRFTRRSELEYKLSRNPRFFAQCEGNPVEQVCFGVSEDPRAVVEEFARGALDLSCDASFPYEQVDRWRGHPDFSLRPGGLRMQLRISADHPALHTPEARRRLEACIDRAALVDALFGVPEALDAFCHRLPPRETLTNVRTQTPRSWPALRLGFTPYHPNDIVARELASQLQRSGYAVELITERFSARETKGIDLALDLVFEPFADPLALLLPWAFTRTLIAERDDFRRYLAWLEAYGADATGWPLPQMEQLLRDVMPGIPLLSLPFITLRRSTLAPLDLRPRQLLQWTS